MTFARSSHEIFSLSLSAIQDTRYCLSHKSTLYLRGGHRGLESRHIRQCLIAFISARIGGLDRLLRLTLPLGRAPVGVGRFALWLVVHDDMGEEGEGIWDGRVEGAHDIFSTRGYQKNRGGIVERQFHIFACS